MFGFFPKHQNVANLRSRSVVKHNPPGGLNNRCFNLFAGDVFTGKKFIQTLRDSKADCHSAVFFNVGFTSQTQKKKTPSRRGGSLRTRTAVLSLGAVSTLGAKLLGREKWGWRLDCWKGHWQFLCLPNYIDQRVDVFEVPFVTKDLSIRIIRIWPEDSYHLPLDPKIMENKG